MKYSDFISGIFWLVIGVLLSAWSFTYDLGSIIDPGPGFLPLGLGLLLIFLSLILIGQATKMSRVEGKEAFPIFDGLGTKVYAVLTLLLASFLFETLGYLLTVFLLIFFLMLGMELQNWKKILFFAFFTTLGIYIVFVLILKQPLPPGILRTQ